MTATDGDAPAPDHVEDSIQHLAEMQQRHVQTASRLQRVADWATKLIGLPTSIIVIMAAVTMWVAVNGYASAAGSRAIDPPPYVGLEITATIFALVIVLLILATQRHADELAAKRAQLTLQIAVLSEKKIAKVIELLEEQRRDNPTLPDRTDSLAEEMGKATNPSRNLERIEAVTP